MIIFFSCKWNTTVNKILFTFTTFFTHAKVIWCAFLTFQSSDSRLTDALPSVNIALGIFRTFFIAFTFLAKMFVKPNVCKPLLKSKNNLKNSLAWHPILLVILKNPFAHISHIFPITFERHSHFPVILSHFPLSIAPYVLQWQNWHPNSVKLK